MTWHLAGEDDLGRWLAMWQALDRLPRAVRSGPLENAMLRAARVLLDWRAGIDAIPGHVRVDRISDVRGSVPRDKAAFDAQLSRDALLRLRALHLLMNLAHQPPTGSTPLSFLAPQALTGDGAVPPGITPRGFRGDRMDLGAWAETKNAQAFFEIRVRPVLVAIAADVSAAPWLALNPPKVYEPADPANLVVWSLLWSRGVAHMALEWLARTGDDHWDGLIQSLCNGNLPSFRPARRFVADGTVTGATCKTERRRVPTLLAAEHGLYLHLWGDPVLCRLLDAHSAAPLVDSHFAVVDLATKQLGHYQSRGEHFDGGKCIAQLYLSVWISRVSPSVSYRAIPTLPVTPVLRQGLPDDLALGTSPGHHAGLVWLLARMGGAGPRASGVRSRRFVSATDPKETDVTGDGVPGELLRTIHDFQPAGAPGTKWLGSIRLWGRLREVAWIDLALTVRVGGRWHAVPLVMDDSSDTEVDEGTARTWIAVDWPADPPLPIDRLREAMASAALWARRYKGQGVFVTGAVDAN